MCFDPVSASLLIGGAAAGGAGSLIGKNDALANAQREAAARNRVLATGVDKQQGYADANRGEFNNTVGNFTAPNQAGVLSDAQDKRTGTITGNMTAPDPGSVPLGDSPAASKSDLAKRMLSVFSAATDRAKAQGKLGGYGDQWLNNGLGVTDTTRNIDTRNNLAATDAAAIAPLQDAAAAASYKPPSIWGPLLQAGGTILGGAAGAGKFNNLFGGTTGAGGLGGAAGNAARPFGNIFTGVGASPY